MDSRDIKKSRAPFHGRWYTFGPYTADLKRRLLWHEQTAVPLNSKTFDVLAALIEHRARILEKDEFLKLVWPDAIVLESNLVRQISMLRRALGQRPDQHDYIVTIPGAGYQFVADVQELESLPDGLVPRTVPKPAEDVPNGVLDVPPPTPEASPAKVVALIAAVLAIVAAGYALVSFTPVDQRSSPRHLQQLTFEPGVPREAAWSPDGTHIAYTSDRAGNADIWVQDVGGAEAVPLTSSPANEHQADWSRDGQWIVFRSERDGGGIDVVSAKGGEPRRVTNFGSWPKWSPDGTKILIHQAGTRSGARALFVVPAEGGTPRQVLADVINEFISRSPTASVRAAWHPDGQRISIWGRHAKTGWTFVTAPLSGSPVVRSVISETVQEALRDADLTLGTFVWSPSRDAVYFEGISQGTQNAWRIGVNPETLSWVRGPDRLTTNTGEDRDLAISADGTKLAFTVRSSNTRVWSLPFDAALEKVVGSGQPLTSGAADEAGADVLADGSKIAYRAVRAGRQELRTHSIINGQDRLLLASTTLNRSNPRWSRDGRLLAYSVSRQAPDAPWQQVAVGVLEVEAGAEQLHQTKVEFVPMDWSKQDDTILGYCRSSRTASTGTCLLSLSQGALESPVRMIAVRNDVDQFGQQFSPDERWIGFVATSTRNPDSARVYLQPADGGAWQAISDGKSYAEMPRWSRDGRILYYFSERDGFVNVWGRRVNAQTGQPVGESFQVTSFSDERRTISRIEMAVTKRALFLPIKETSGEIWVLDQIDR